MPQMIFVNLPVTDIARARTFYASLGFTFDPRFQDESTACVVVSDTIFFMIMEHAKFAGFAPRPLADPATSTAALIALSRDSRADVDTFVAAALAHGGTDNNKPQVMGDYMYGQSVSDPDGNVLEVMWMDVAAAMKAWGMEG
jgi:uncharacterized protein